MVSLVSSCSAVAASLPRRLRRLWAGSSTPPASPTRPATDSGGLCARLTHSLTPRPLPQLYPASQPDEALGADPWPPAGAGGDGEEEGGYLGPLPAGAVCRDAVTGVPLDEMGFQLDPPAGGGGGGPLSMGRLPSRRAGGRHASGF